MKKNKDIKIIKSNSTTKNNYTFIDGVNTTTKPIGISLIDMENEIWSEQTTQIIKNKEEKYKKKKVMSKYDAKNNNSNKALKYTNQSQRNHSSVYE